jgi:hypothetical protein
MRRREEKVAGSVWDTLRQPVTEILQVLGEISIKYRMLRWVETTYQQIFMLIAAERKMLNPQTDSTYFSVIEKHFFYCMTYRKANIFVILLIACY